jgi:PDZ domain
MSVTRIFTAALTAGISFSFTAAAQDAAPAPAPEKSMLRVNITSQGWNFALPWQKMNPGTRRGLGALLPGNRVLVTGELAQDASYVELEIASSGRKLVSKVEAVDYELNLATIVPQEDPGDFFKGMIPLQVDSGLKPKATLNVWQYEANGAPVSSDIELARADIAPYFLEDSAFLIFQANGAVQYRGGTFTLPVVREGKLAGMLIRYNSRDQVSDIIPPLSIDRFLKDAESAPYEGVPNFGAKTANTLDPALRRFLKIDSLDGGVLITGITPGFSAEKSGLKENDVILEVAGFKLDSRGNYTDPDLGLLSAGHLIRSTPVGGSLKMKIQRDGQAQEVSVKMERRQPGDYLVDPYMFDRGPRYLILGGLLFQELTQQYLQLGGREWRDRAPFRLLFARENQEDFLKQGRRKLVFLSGVLPSPSIQGYERLRGLIVTKVNNKEINDIKDLAAALEAPLDGVHKIEFTDYPMVIHVDAEGAAQDNKEFLPARYRINKLQRLE